jgi:hypothetical protein
MRALLTTFAELAGLGFVAAGCWLILPAAGLIAGGLGLVLVGYLAASPPKAGNP